jgi:hypothetical protein
MPDEPIRTTTFTLSRADSLAYEQAASRLTPLGVIALICWLGLCGAAALLIPADWAGVRLSVTSSLLISIAVAIGYVVALLIISSRQWWRARRRYRRPLEVTVTEWPDRLDVVGTGTLDAVPFTGIRRSLLTRTHLFLDTDAEPLILPRRAFAEEGAVENLARRIDGAPRPAPAGPEPPVPPAPQEPPAP